MSQAAKSTNIVSERPLTDGASVAVAPGVGMVYFAMSPWDDMWRSRHQLMSRFAMKMPVLYVEPYRSLKDLRRRRFSMSGIWRACSRPSVEHQTAGLHVFKTTDRLPVSGNKLLAGVTKKRWLDAVMRQAARVGIRQPIVWISRPEMYDFCDLTEMSFSIYHVVDEYTGYTLVDGQKKRRLREVEELALDAVDLTIVVSPELLRSKSAAGRDVVIVENAVDAERFAKKLKIDSLPSDLFRIPGPRLGYSGLINQRLDLDLLAFLAEQRPDWSLVLVGHVDRRKCESSFDLLEAMPNVHFLGQRDVDEIPALMAGFDVCLLPYRATPETRNLSPLKMYEYFATGRPIVSTPVPAALRKEGLVEIADNSEIFLKKCEEALSEQPSQAVEARLAEARANSWDARIDQIAGLIRERMD